MVSKSVESSNISSVGHDGETLFIRFNSGITYRYENVPNIVYELMIEAESVGKFFHHHIKGKFPYSKVEGDPVAGETPLKMPDKVRETQASA